MTTFGRKIREIRESQKLSRPDLFLLCKVSVCQIERIENDKASPSLSTMTKIADALGVSLWEIVESLNQGGK
jgi:transcriptional regulator with XRE-family HTH domain